MEEIAFLGTGGGRFVMITQWRATGGFRVNFENFNILIDPGPGSLVRAKEYKQSAMNVDCLAVSHVHPDHCTDANAVIEAMTSGMTKEKGYVLGSESVLDGIEANEPCITTYHKQMPKEIRTMQAGDEVTFEDVKIKALKTKHRDPTTIGFKISSGDKTISYTSDTEYFKELEDEHKGVDILVLNVLRPKAERIPFHMCTEDAVKLLKGTKPKVAIVQHFGIKMLKANPFNEAKKIEQGSGVRTIAAKDGMKISLDETDQTTLKEFKNEK